MTVHALGDECVACIASRRSTVDAFLHGFRAGFRNSVIAHIEGAGGVPTVEGPKFCLTHDRMVTEAYADEVRVAMGLPPIDTGKGK